MLYIQYISTCHKKHEGIITWKLIIYPPCSIYLEFSEIWYPGFFRLCKVHFRTFKDPFWAIPEMNIETHKFVLEILLRKKQNGHKTDHIQHSVWWCLLIFTYFYFIFPNWESNNRNVTKSLPSPSRNGDGRPFLAHCPARISHKDGPQAANPLPTTTKGNNAPSAARERRQLSWPPWNERRLDSEGKGYYILISAYYNKIRSK